MKNKKTCIKQFAYYDKTGIVKYLEEQALLGWKLVKTNSVIWHFERIEKMSLKYEVTYFTKASQFDAKPTNEQKDFEEFCKHHGWELVGESGELKIFCNENENAVPIETDPITEVKAIIKACKQNVQLLFGLYLFNGAIQLSFWTFQFIMNPLKFLGNDCSLIGVFWSLIIWIISSGELIRYNIWLSNAKKAARNGEFLETKCVNNMIIAGAVSIISGLGLLWGYIAGGNVVSVMIVILGVILCTALCCGICTILKKFKVSAKVNMIVTYVLAGITGLALVFGMIFYFDAYINKNNGQSSILITYEDEVIKTEQNGFEYVDVRYTRVRIKAGFTYNFVKKIMIKTNKDSYTEDVNGNKFFEEFRKTDAVKWSAKEAYVLSLDDTDLGEYVLCYEDEIIRIKSRYELTPKRLQEIMGE